MNKLFKVLLTASMLFTIVPQTLYAKENGGNVVVTEDGDTVTIGNQFMKRTFHKKGNKWSTKSIENKRINETFTPSEGSQDFSIHLVDESKEENPTVVAPKQVLNRKDWKAKITNKSGKEFDQSHVTKLFDGDKNTSIDEYTKTEHPFSLEINLGSKQNVSSFGYLKRPGFKEEAYGVNGSIGKYKLYVSEDGKKWNLAGNGEFTKEDYHLRKEDQLFNVGDVVYANFNQTYVTQYVKVEVLSDVLGGSQEFTGAEFNLYSDKVNTGLPVKEINLKDKKITFKHADASQLSDGNVQFSLSSTLNEPIVIDLGSKMNVGSFAYHKRPGYQDKQYGKNGTMGKYELFVSENGSDWIPAGKGEFTEKDHHLHTVVLDEDLKTSDGTYKKGDTLYNVGDFAYGNLNQVYPTRYVKIVPKSDCLGNLNEFSVTEIKLFEDQKFEKKKVDQSISSNDLVIEKITKGTNDVRVSFAPYQKQGVMWSIDMVTVMENGKHYMNSYLEITADKPDAARIDYIDFDRFIVDKNTKGVWSIPDENKISSMWIGKHELMLGQPIYADGLFFGSEFPAQDTDIVNDAMQIRYYSGKSIARMAKDGQNVKDGTTFRTWNNVIGAATGTQMDVVQTDFFKYIEDIATPSKFRKQYNSWYDNMMNINDNSIEKSFLGSEKGLAENGIEPLDSYVVDDGWNNYNNNEGNVHAPGESGTTLNQTGFWEFNDKFPNELYTSSHLADKLNSSFGVWVGPQGGYNFFGGFADYLEAMGTGYAQTNSALGKVVCTGSRKYIHNFEKRFTDYQTRFNIDYWKWDGFASRPCNNPKHDHMVGGDHNMYFTSDMWEAWTDLFENVREARRKEGKDLWINATCYINLSPWLLQWVNTIWVQDSGDTGEAGDKAAARHQRKIYYRDDVYNNLYKVNELQFPLKNIYNHDPIYGVSDSSSATTEVFREFLFDNAMRGTAFWELYYSPSIFDDAKWKVTVDALDFAEKNHDVLKNAKLFVQEGKKPSNGVYGYSAWDNTKGFVSFVNPTNKKQTYTLTLNNIVGVPTGMKDLTQTRIYPYASTSMSEKVNYGDNLTVTLEPFSSQIYEFGSTDHAAPQLVSAKIKSNDKIEVRFNERVSDKAQFVVNGAKQEAKLLDDYRTFEIKASGLKDYANLKITEIRDIYGNKAADVNEKIRTANKIVDINKKADLGIKSNSVSKDLFHLDNKEHKVANEGIKGNVDFSVSLLVDTLDSNVTLLQQADDYKLSIDQDGYIVFDIKGNKISSKEEIVTVKEKAHGRFNTESYVETTTNKNIVGKINDGQMHTVNAVRELNGTIKLYIDGRLSSSFYKKGEKDNLTGNKIILGDKKFNGYVANVTVKNSASYYDDAAKFAQQYNIGKTTKQLDKAGWKASACSQASNEVKPNTDGAAASVLDNNPSTYWHSDYRGNDTCKNIHTLTIDFQKETSFDALEYVARPGGSASNGTWEKVNVIGIDANGKETKLMTDQIINLTNNGYLFQFDKMQTFNKIRFEIQGKGGFASAAEINAYEKINTDTSEVLKIQKEAQELLSSIQKEDYEASSYEIFVNKVDDIMNMDVFASKETVNKLRKELQEAYKGLKENPELTPIGPSSHKIPWTDLEPAHKEVPMTELKPATKVEKPNSSNKVEQPQTPNTGVETNTAVLWGVLLGAGMALFTAKRKKLHK